MLKYYDIQYATVIGFREWVPIRNIIGGAAGAHIPMTFGLPLSACVNNSVRVSATEVALNVQYVPEKCYYKQVRRYC